MVISPVLKCTATNNKVQKIIYVNYMKMLRCMCDVNNIDWMKSCMKLKKKRVDTRDGVVYSGQVRDRRWNYTNVTTIFISLYIDVYRLFE